MLPRHVYTRELSGDGLEIGPLHSPLPLPAGARVRYVDHLDLKELRAHNPDVPSSDIVAPDILADGHRLPTVPDASVDFVAASHVIEHLHNPIAALLEWRRVLRPGGKLLLFVPDGRYTFDRGRPFTSLDHLLWDYVNDGTDLKQLSDLSHVAECSLNQRKLTIEAALELAARVVRGTYDTHFHVWSYDSFSAQLGQLRARHRLPFTVASSVADEALEMCFLLTANRLNRFTLDTSGVPVVSAGRSG